jgi:hypothetical protein
MTLLSRASRVTASCQPVRAVPEQSRKARAIGADPRVSVHLELVREVVVLDGTVEETEPAAEAADAYAEKYGWRPPAAQRWYVLRPRSCYAADEATFPESATVFTLVEEA